MCPKRSSALVSVHKDSDTPGDRGAEKKGNNEGEREGGREGGRETASISMPRRTRGVAATPYSAKMSTNTLQSAAFVGAPSNPAVGLRGMRLTWQLLLRERRSFPSFCANSGVSFCPATRAHSKVMRRPVSLTYSSHADIRSRRGQRTLTGMMAFRSSSDAACRETASLTCNKI